MLKRIRQRLGWMSADKAPEIRKSESAIEERANDSPIQTIDEDLYGFDPFAKALV